MYFSKPPEPWNLATGPPPTISFQILEPLSGTKLKTFWSALRTVVRWQKRVRYCDRINVAAVVDTHSAKNVCEKEIPFHYAHLFAGRSARSRQCETNMLLSVFVPLFCVARLHSRVIALIEQTTSRKVSSCHSPAIGSKRLSPILAHQLPRPDAAVLYVRMQIDHTGHSPDRQVTCLITADDRKVWPCWVRAYTARTE